LRPVADAVADRVQRASALSSIACGGVRSAISDRAYKSARTFAPVTKAGHKLQTIIKKVRRHLFVFVTNRDLTATNNGSERALRPCVIYRKITNGFRSQWGAALYADIRSVVETARRRSIRAIDAIRLTLEGLPIPCLA
jgi:hypothetical protein